MGVGRLVVVVVIVSPRRKVGVLVIVFDIGGVQMVVLVPRGVERWWVNSIATLEQ